MNTPESRRQAENELSGMSQNHDEGKTPRPCEISPMQYGSPLGPPAAPSTELDDSRCFFEDDDATLGQVPPWWRFLLRGSTRGSEEDMESSLAALAVDGGDSMFDEDLSTEGGHQEEDGRDALTSRCPSELDEDSAPSSRKTSRESQESRENRDEGTIYYGRGEPRPKGDALPPRPPLDRRDSLMEAVLAAKRGGWSGLKRTDSLESAASLTSSAASSAASDCTCDDCVFGFSDVALGRAPARKKKKNSNWKKVRNVVQWTPFIQTYKRQKYPWVQLAGHQGNFKAGHRQGSIMKKLCPAEEKAFETLQHDALQSFVPEYMGIVEGSDGDKYLQLQDLLSNFTSPCVMDIKMGVRTYLEEELAKARHKPKLRKDMYEKMIQIDPKAPTEPENRAKAVTKPRYMVWRETISSTATLGFRIEGVRRGDGSSSKDFKTTRTRDQVMTALASFVDRYSEAVVHYIDRLKEIKFTLEKSTFFKTHELIGSSLLFVHNAEKSGVWLIDFAKTIPLPDSVKTTHRVPWVEGTHEDGYLIGLENLIDIFEGLDKNTLSKGETTHINQADKIVPNAQKDALSLLTNAKTNEEANTESVPNSSPKISPVTKSLSLKEAQSETFTQGAQMHSSVTKTQSFAMGSGGALYMHTKNKNVAGVIERKCLTSQGTEKKAN